MGPREGAFGLEMGNLCTSNNQGDVINAKKGAILPNANNFAKGPEKISPQEAWYSADMNGDGKLSKKEFKKAMRNHQDLADFLEVDDNKGIKALFDQIDDDDSGVITKEEFLAKFDPAAVEAADVKTAGEENQDKEAAKLFDLMDTSQDGNLSQKEIMTYIKANENTMLAQYFGGEGVSTTQKKKKVRAFCEAVAALDGKSKAKGGGFDV